MRRLLLSMFMIIAAMGSAIAGDVTFDFTNPASLGYAVPASGAAVNVVDGATMVSGDVTIAFAQNGASNPTRFWGTTGGTTELRGYAKATFTITAKGNNITNIAVKGGKVSSTLMSFGEGTYAENVWTGATTTLVITLTGTINLESFAITTTAADGVADPMFSPVGGVYYEAQSVTLTSPTVGADIYYTTDGTAPTVSSTKYTAPIAVSATTTLKAIAAKGGKLSEVAEATYTIKALPEVDNIAAFLATNTSGATKTELYKIKNPVTVLYQDGQYLFVKDATGSMQIYGRLTTTYNNGDVIPAGITGSVALYGGLYQMVPTASSFAAGTAGAAALPDVFTIATLTLAEANRYILIKNVTVDATAKRLTDNTASIDYYNRFSGVTAPVDEQKYDVVGIMNSFNGTLQIFPISFTPSSGSGVANMENASVKVMGGHGVINITADENAQLVVVNTLGQVLTNQTIVSGESTISVSQGIYMVKVNNKVTKVLVK